MFSSPTQPPLNKKNAQLNATTSAELDKPFQRRTERAQILLQ